MAVGSKNQNYRVGPGSQGSSWRSSGNGVNAGKWSYDGYSGVNKGFSDLYSKVGSWNEKNNQEFWASKEEDQEPERRQMSGLETFMAGLSKGAEDIAGMAGFQEAKESGDPVRTIGSFLASIPTGIASSVPSGISKGFEAFSGVDLQSANQEDNTISSEKLSPSQRAASGVSGAIDIVGLGTGGSGRLIGGAIKGGAKALGKEAPDVFTGWATKAGGGKVAQFASDTFMEGLEEGVQTAVDDVRNEQFGADTFSRSLEAFGYGALAGGVMHGAGIGIEAAGNKIDSMRGGSSNTVSQKTNKQNIDADLSAADPWAEQQEMLKASMGATEITPSGREAMKETLRRESETPGTASAVSTVSSESVRMNQHRMGADTIMSVFYNNDGNKSANEVVNAFKRSGATDIDGTELTVQKMDAAFRSADPMSYINGIIQTTPRKSVRMVLGRNPDSKTGTWTSDLVEVVPGSGMQMNRSVYQMSGGDVDGDKTQAYFDEASLAESLGYATAQLNNPSTGLSNVDFDFFAIDDVSSASGKNAESVRKKYEDYFYSTIASYSGSRNDKNAKKLLDSFFEATSSENGKSRGDMVAQSLSDMRAFAMSRLDEAGDPDSGYNADAILQDFIFGVNRASQFSAVIENEVQSAIREAEASLDSIELPSDGMEFVGSEGSVGNAKRVSQLLPYMGYSTSTSSKEGNPPFRQYQEIIWSAKKHEQLFEEGIDGTVTRNAFDKVLALSLRLRAIGEVPETTVESTFKNFVAHETLQNTVSKNGKMSTDKDLETMLSSFRDSYNKYAAIFDEAVKEDSLRGRFVPLSAKSKNMLEDGEGQDTIRAFVDVFSNFQAKDLFYLDDSCSDRDATIESIIEETANSVFATGEVFIQNPATSRFFRRALADYGGRERALEKSLRDTIEGDRVSQLVAEATSRMSVDGKFDGKDASSMLMLLDFYNNIVGPEASLRQGLVSIDTIMSTELGRSFFSSVPSQRTNAVVSASLRSTFYDCRTSLSEYERTGDPEYLEHAKLEASIISQISPLHAAAAKEILDLGTTNFLDSMVDANRTIEEKEKAYGSLFRGSMRKPNLLVDALKTKDSKLEVSAVSTRTRKANTSLKSAERLSFDRSKKMLDSVDLLIKNNQVSQRDAVAAMKDLAMRTIDVDREAYLSLLNDQADISAKEGDKGQAPDSATVNYQITSKTVQGMSTSMIQEMFGLPFNTISRTEFNENRSINLMLFFDKDFEIDVVDIVTGADGKPVITMDHYDQRRVFKEILGEQGTYDGPEPSPIQYMNALRKIPQIASRICPSSVNVTTSEGAPSVTEAYDTELSNAILGVVRNPDSSKRSEIRRRAKSMLHNRPEFAAAVCGAADGLSTTSPMNSAYTAEKLEKAYEEIVDYVTNLALSGEGTTRITSIAELRSSSFSGLFDALGMSAAMSSGMNDIMKTAEAATKGQVAQVVQFVADAKYMTNAALEIKRHGGDAMVVDAMTNEIIPSAYASILEKDIENAVQTYEAFASVLIAYSEDLGIVGPGSGLGDMRPSMDAVDKVEKMINGMQGSVSNQEFEAVKRSVAKIKEGGVVSEMSTGDLRALSMADVAENPGENPRQAADRVKAKVKDIVDRFGGEDDWNKGVEDMIDAAFPEYGPDGMWIVDTDEVPGDVVSRNRREVFRYANNIMMRRVTDNVLEGTSRMFDRNALYLTDTTVSFLSEAADDLRKELTSPKSEGGMGLYEDSLGSLMSNSKYSLIPPTMHFDNVVNANMATRAKAAVNASSVAFKVGFEGSMGNAMHAISLLSGHSDPAFCGVKPSKVSVREVLDSPGEYDGLSYQMRDEAGNVVRKGFLGDSMYEKLRTMLGSSEGDMSIEVYRTEDCLDGACKVCGGKPMSNANEDFLHVDFIVSAIFNHMTEKRNLKKKKSTTVLREIVSKIRADVSLKSDILEGDKLDLSYLVQKRGDAMEAAASDMKKMTRLLRTYRSKVSDHYKRFFDEEGIDGLTKKHADIMASFTTPFFSVTFEDGTRAAFSVHSLKDVKSFMDECSKVMVETMEDGSSMMKRISDVKVAVVSPIDVSNKIGANVAFNAIESDMSGKKYNGTDVTKWARDAFHDWSDVIMDGVGSLELYRSVAPSNRSVPTSIRSASSRTVSQYFFQEVESMFTKNWDDQRGGQPSEKCIKSADRVKKRFDGQNGSYGSDCPFTIIRSFVDIGDRAYFAGSSEVLSELKTLEDNTDDGAFGNEWTVLGDSENESTLLKAFNHAKQTGRKVLLPKDSSIVRAKASCVVVPRFKLSDGFEYAILDPAIEKTLAMSVDGMPKSFVDNRFDPRSVFISIAEIGGEFNLPDAGGIVNPNTVGKMIEPWEGIVEISSDGMPAGGLDLSIAKSSDDYYAIKELAKDRESINKWATYLRDQNGGISPDRLSFEVDKWIAKVDAELASDMNSDCFLYSNADRGSCIGFAKKTVNGKVEYLPIVMNMSVPKTIDSIVPMIDGKNVVIGMYSNLTWDDSTDRKLMMDRVPDKEITRLPEGWLRDNWPTLSMSIDGSKVEVDAMYPSATEGSRVADMTVKQLLDNYWYAGRRFGYNTFYKRDDAGNWDIAPALKAMSPSDFKDLMSGKTEQWRKVESGELLLFDPQEYPGACRVSRSIVSNCIMHGINPAEVFCSTVVKPGSSDPAVSRMTNIMYTMALGHLRKQDLNDLFSAMSDGKICPKSDEEYDGSSIFDKNGRVKATVPIVEWDYEGRPNVVGSKEVMYTCHVGVKNSPGISTDLGAVSGSGSYSTQHVVKRGIENYVPDEFINRMVDYISIKNGMYSRFMDDPSKCVIPNDDMKKYVPIDRNKYEFVEAALDSPIDSYRERDRRAKIMMESDNYRKTIPVKLADGVTVVTPDSNTPQGESLSEAIAGLRKDLGVNLTWKEVNILVREQTGWTVNGGSGLDFLYLDHVIEAIEAMRATLRNTNGKLLIEGGQSPFGDRISFPLLPKFMADRIWSSQKIREANGNDRSFWEQDMVDSMRTKTSVAIENMNMNKFSESRKKALKRHADYLYLDNGINPDDTMVYGDTSLKDIFDSDNLLLDALFGKDKVVSEEWRKKNQEQLKKIEGIKKQAAGDGNVTVMATDTEAGFISRKKHKEIDVPRKVLRDMSALSKLNATLSLPLAIGNTADRLVNQTLMGTMLNLGSIGVGPYSGGIVLSKDTIKGVSHDENFRKIYEAHRLASFDASEIDFLAKVKTAEDVDKFLNARFQSMGLFEKWQDRIQNLVSGGNIGLNGQIENMVTRFAQRAGVDGHDWWNTKVGNSTLLEQQLRTNPSKWFLDIISGKNAADHSLLMQSINWARRGDMAQKNIISVVYGEMVKDRPVAEFLTSTMVCRFVQYTTNKTGRVLNWVAPVSSINYLATNFAANTEFGKRLNLQDVQVNANFREALIVDAMHMTLPTIALFLAAMTGAIEPPEDEDKWGNYEEWTIFGQRVQAAWWIEDIIGPAIPLAAFYRSVQLGNPRIDIVTKAYSNMLWSNPMVKVGEFLTGFLESGFEEDEADGYNMDYADSRFGQPSSPERLVGDAAGVALSYAGQFVTPSWLKEIYNSMQEFEVSYKRIYEENEVGNLTEAGIAGETMKTSYFDSQIRKVTRNNPVLGAFMDLVTDSNTGYMASEMPRTVMYDQDQINSVQLYSMYEADGVTPKPVQQQQAIVLEVIGILQSTDDMEALYNSGFMLSYDTKKAVGDALYDTWHALDVEYNRMAMNGEFDAYFYSDDFNEGLAMATQAREVLKAEKAYWQSMYYDKLWSEPMNRGLAQYNRRKTTYAQDDNGDWYATGTMQNPFGVLPVVLSPGKTTNEDGYMLNMGREEDWAAQSIVTGGSTGQRALVPIEPDKVEIPDFEGLGDSSNGGYSSSYPGSGYSNYGRSSGYRGYNYGGGYYSRSYGGGGGSSYTPDIYSRLPSIYSSSPKVMYADRLYAPSFDYMYPKFETKGSRESYKRQDI